MIDKTGGAAFPYSDIYYCNDGEKLYQNKEQGMTLLDYYAGVAMECILAKALSIHSRVAPLPDSRSIASDAYYYAEAMIAERERRERDKKNNP